MNFVEPNLYYENFQNEIDINIANSQEIHDFSKIETALCIPAPILGVMDNVISGYKKNKLPFLDFFLGSQDISSFAEFGPYTGEFHGEILKKIPSCKYTIIGHSERRKYFGEDHKLLQSKLHASLKHGIIPIFCIGENEKNSKNLDRIIHKQVLPIIKLFEEFPTFTQSKILIAYEPVWAIGSGQIPNDQEINNFLTKTCEYIGVNLPILYGGSVSNNNIEFLMKESNIDGVLVGGVSLKPRNFAQLALSILKILL